MSVREHKSEKKNSFRCAEWFYKGWTSQGAVTVPKEALAEGRVNTSTQRAPLPGHQRAWAGLTTWLWLPRLTEGEHRVDNSVSGTQMTIQFAHWPVLTPQHQQNQTTATNLFHPKRLNTEGKLILLGKAGKLPWNHFRAWFDIHDCSRSWQFWLLLLSFLCLLRKGPLRGAVFPVDEGCGEMMLSVFGDCHSHPTDGFLESTCICLPSQPRISHCGCFVTTLMKISDENLCLWSYLVGRKKSNWDAESYHVCFSEFQTHCWQL